MKIYNEMEGVTTHTTKAQQAGPNQHINPTAKTQSIELGRQTFK